MVRANQSFSGGPARGRGAPKALLCLPKPKWRMPCRFYADTQTPSHAAWLVNAVFGFVADRARSVLQILKNRREAAMLVGLDDRMLADIGLTRGDLRDAISEPVWRDPTAILVSRAHERRINRRRTSIGLAPKGVRRAVDRPVCEGAGVAAAWRAY